MRHIILMNTDRGNQAVFLDPEHLIRIYPLKIGKSYLALRLDYKKGSVWTDDKLTIQFDTHEDMKAGFDYITYNLDQYWSRIESQIESQKQTLGFNLTKKK